MALDAAPLDLAALPVIVVGPVLRRLTRTEASVWVALRLGADVTLNVRRAGSAGPPQATTVTPTRVGRNLWLTVLTSPGVDAGRFDPGVTYEYWVSSPTWPAAQSPVWSDPAFSYATPTPRFVAPPDRVDDLRLVQTSCRKPHGAGRDALGLLDDTIAAGTARPHLLVLTGDQIYADDVAAPLVPRLRRVAADLVDIDESDRFGALPAIEGRGAPTATFGFTSDAASNHLWTFAEYLSMYLLAWSDVLWPAALPAWAEIDPATDLAAGHGLTEATWSDLVVRLDRYRVALPQVRRVLANVPTLMVFDDHEVSDDWNLDLPWAQTIHADPNGRRVVTNGLLAYALCQHWGNAPGPFAVAGTSAATVLAGAAWSEPGTSPDTPPLSAALGIPVNVAAAPTQLRDVAANGGLRYDVRLEPADGWPARLILLDERTARGYPTATGPASRISAANLDAMLAPPAAGEAPAVTIVVAPAPIAGFRLVEHFLQPAGALLDGNAAYDVESWTGVDQAIEQLLDRLSAFGQVVVLSGDVHYGYATRGRYEQPAGTTRLVAAQLTASGAKNADVLAMTLHTLGDLLQRLGIERPRRFDGYSALSAPQRDSLRSPPVAGSALPYDDTVDVLLGRVVRDGASTPAVFTNEVATAYALGAPDWSWSLAHHDDESLPADPNDVANIAAAAALPPSNGWQPADSFEIVRALQASDRNRIGRVFTGLPQLCWMTFAGGPPPVVTSEHVMAAEDTTMRTVAEVALA